MFSIVQNTNGKKKKFLAIRNKAANINPVSTNNRHKLIQIRQTNVPKCPQIPSSDQRNTKTIKQVLK